MSRGFGVDAVATETSVLAGFIGRAGSEVVIDPEEFVVASVPPPSDHEHWGVAVVIEAQKYVLVHSQTLPLMS